MSEKDKQIKYLTDLCHTRSDEIKELEEWQATANKVLSDMLPELEVIEATAVAIRQLDAANAAIKYLWEWTHRKGGQDPSASYLDRVTHDSIHKQAIERALKDG